MEYKSSSRDDEGDSKSAKMGISRVDSEYHHVLTVNDDDEEDLHRSKFRLGTLDLSIADSKQTQKLSAKEEPDIQEEELLVIFDLPDGSQGEQSFKLGQTIEVLKSFVESEYGIPMMEQKLFLDTEGSAQAEGKELHNPFSLLDYAEVKGNSMCKFMCIRTDNLCDIFQ